MGRLEGTEFARNWDYGLPFSTRQGTEGTEGVGLSSEVIDGSTRVRSRWVKYTHDTLPPDLQQEDQKDVWVNTNRRIAIDRTRFNDDDGNKWVETWNDLNSFDGLGHFRKTWTKWDLDSASSRIDTTQYNSPLNGTPGCYNVEPGSSCGSSFVLPSTGAAWLLNDFTFKQQEEGTLKARQNFVFNAGTGFLECTRVLRTGTTRSTTDVLVTFSSAGSDGNVTSEKWYGGDLEGAEPGLGTGASCSAGTNLDYRLEHSYSKGVRATSEYYTTLGTSMGFKVLDQTIDPSTGWITSAEDTAGRQTTFSYDGLGRLTASTPGGSNPLAPTSYTYSFSGGGATSYNKVQIYTSCPSGDSGCTSPVLERETWFDGFGRVAKERVKRPAPATGFTEKASSYDSSGRLTQASEWGVAIGTSYSDFDAFGRPEKITPADGAGHNVTLAYKGVREVKRTVWIGTSLPPGAEAQHATTERYDGLGRLTKVLDPLGTTDYFYDIGNRLARVEQRVGLQAPFDLQTRVFAYDNRGFLSSETNPEKGGSGNGTVSYADYDARGHAGSMSEPGPEAVTIRYVFDAAERLTDVSSGGALLKKFTYDESGRGESKGKLTTAESINDLSSIGLAYVVKVTEKTSYNARGGLASALDTEVLVNTTDFGTFSQTFTRTPLGGIATQSYPNWSLLSSPRTVSHAYSQGFLTSVTGTQPTPVANYATALTYHDNLTLATVVHGNNVTDTIAKDPSSLPRPGSITTSGVLSSQNWLSGAYQFDGAGNVRQIGADKFKYDSVSRLVQGDLSGYGSQAVEFDGFGNITRITTGGVQVNTETNESTNRLETSGADYDSRGNLTNWSATVLYSFDELNRMRDMKNGTEHWVFVYGPNDERILAYAANGTEIGTYRWTLRDPGGKILREIRDSGGVKRVQHDFIYRGDQLLAAEVYQQGRRHFTLDHLGSPRLVTDNSKARTSFHTYYPFGQEATATSQNTIPTKFTGHERDLYNTAGAADDLDYMKARFNSPLTGRFLAVDKAPRSSKKYPQSWNRYAYARGNPLKFVDPTGLYVEVPASLRGAVANAYSRSAMFRQVFDAANSNKRILAVLVAVKGGRGASTVGGATSWKTAPKEVVTADGARVWSGTTQSNIKIGRSPEDTGGTVAHELQHVLELSLYGDIRKAPDARVGVGHTGNLPNPPYETESAQKVGSTVSREIEGSEGAGGLPTAAAALAFSDYFQGLSSDTQQACLSDVACLALSSYGGPSDGRRP